MEKDRFERELLETNELIKKKELTKKDALRKTLEDPENAEIYKQIIIDISREIHTLNTAEKIKNDTMSPTEEMKIDMLRKLLEVVIVRKDSLEVVYKFKSILI